MGQYLTIGIATRIVADKERAERIFKNIADFKSAFEKQFNESGIYQMKETDSAIILELKSEAVESEWIEFISEFYELRYMEKRSCNEVIKALSTTDSLQDWMNIADEKRFECYQADEYVRYPIEGPNHFSALYVRVEQVILSLDGKIIMECYNDLFAFFTRLLREKLGHYCLAGGLLVYITG